MYAVTVELLLEDECSGQPGRAGCRALDTLVGAMLDAGVEHVAAGGGKVSRRITVFVRADDQPSAERAVRALLVRITADDPGAPAWRIGALDQDR